MPDLPKKIQDMKQQGHSPGKIVDSLKKEGHTSQDIYNSMTDSSAEGYAESSLETPAPTSEEMGAEPTPAPQAVEEENLYPPQQGQPPSNVPSRQQIEQIEEVAESIVDEKWQEISSQMSNLNMWKERVSSEVEAIKQELLRVRNHQENLQNTMLGKVDSYNKNIINITAEMRAMEKVLEKILQPLVMNIKELGRITEVFKKIPKK